MAAITRQLYEQTLVLRGQIGDEAAFAELLTLYAPRLLRFIERMMPNSQGSVEDLAQEIWVAIFRGFPRLRDAARFQSWAFRIARDRIYREYRRRKMLLQPLEEGELEANQQYPEEETMADTEEVQRCLGTIAPEQREALVLRFFENMSYDEIANVTGVSVGTIRSRIHYGKRALRDAWKGVML